MTSQLFSEILDIADGDIETLEIEKNTTDSQDAPTEEERAAIERVQAILKTAMAGIQAEIARLKK